MIGTYIGILIPLLGTTLGAMGVFFIKKTHDESIGRYLNGFAAGVMFAASVWSLLIPAIEQCWALTVFSLVIPLAGFWIGVVFLIILEKSVSKIRKRAFCVDIKNEDQHKTLLTALAVVLHNIPEGMAVGAAFAATILSDTPTASTAATSLAIGIAVQNIPEGAVISMPAHAHGVKKNKAFLLGVLSGVVEPIASFITIRLSAIIISLLPFFLSFAAGAMIWVVVSELIPDNKSAKTAKKTALSFCLGFTIMMALDVALG